MSFIKDQTKYRQAVLLNKMGHSVLAELFLRAAYGVN